MKVPKPARYSDYVYLGSDTGTVRSSGRQGMVPPPPLHSPVRLAVPAGIRCEHGLI